MSRTIIGALLAAVIAVLTGMAYFMATSKLQDEIHDDVKRRVAKAQELLIQNSSLEMLRLLKHAEALAMDPQLAEAVGAAEGATPDPILAEQVFKKFRAQLRPDEKQPDVMAMTDDQGRLIALMSGNQPVASPVRDSYLDKDKIKYPALRASIENQIVTSEIWDYEGLGPMTVTVAPILDPDVNATLGTVLVAYAISDKEAKHQHKLLGADVVYFHLKEIAATSFATKTEVEGWLGKTLFEGGLAKEALAAESGLSDIKPVSHGGEEYLVTAGRLPRYSSKALLADYPEPGAGAMVMISKTKAGESVGMIGMLILFVGFGSAILLFVAINLTAKRILQPLEEIEIGVNDIINGNLDRTFEPVGSDLDGLANALNVMLARLLGRPEPGEEEFDEDGNIIRSQVQLPQISHSGTIDMKQAEAEALAAEPLQDYLRRVHREYEAAQHALGDTSPVEYEGFVTKLQANEVALKQKYGAREVRFKVVSEGGKVTLKPLPIM
jgi:hypothetical protein